MHLIVILFCLIFVQFIREFARVIEDGEIVQGVWEDWTDRILLLVEREDVKKVIPKDSGCKKSNQSIHVMHRDITCSQVHVYMYM